MPSQIPALNLVDAILSQCRFQPPAAAICAPGAQIRLVSYRRLEQFIHNSSRKLEAFGLAPGSIAAVDIREPALQVAIILALMRLGVASVSVRDSVPSSLAVEAIFSDRPAANFIGPKFIPVDLSWTSGDGTPIDTRHGPPNGADTICRIILTSGTTGTPKGVGISQQLLSARIQRHLTIFGNRLPECSRIICDLPLATSLGFQFLIYTLLRGGTFFFAGDTFEDMIAAFEEFKAQCLVTSPIGLETFLKFYEQYPLYQSKFEVAVSGGDLLSKPLSTRVRSRLCSHLISVYGSTETSTAAAAPAHVVADTPGAVGYVSPGIEVEVVDESERILPPASEGLIRVRTAFAVDHYLGSKDEPLSPLRDGWFYPGDIGSVSTDGLLRITGRQKSILSIGGSKVNPETVEAALCAYEGIDECAAFSAPNRLGNEEVWVAVVTNSKFKEESLREHCRTVLPLHFLPSGFVIVDELARNAMGKIEREKIKSLAAARPE